MAGTEKSKKPEEAEPARSERARARAYLDLWERQLVQAATDSPAAGWIPARRAARLIKLRPSATSCVS